MRDTLFTKNDDMKEINQLKAEVEGGNIERNLRYQKYERDRKELEKEIKHLYEQKEIY